MIRYVPPLLVGKNGVPVRSAVKTVVSGSPGPESLMDLAPQAPLLFQSALIPLKQEVELRQNLRGKQVAVEGVIANLSNAEGLRVTPHRTAVTQPEGSCLQGSERQRKGQGSQRLFHIPLIASRELSDQVGGEFRDISTGSLGRKRFGSGRVFRYSK
jgi:hypothetical protein